MAPVPAILTIAPIHLLAWGLCLGMEVYQVRLHPPSARLTSLLLLLHDLQTNTPTVLHREQIPLPTATLRKASPAATTHLSFLLPHANPSDHCPSR